MEGGAGLGAFLGLALAGSLHCGGMCGPLAVLACGKSKTRLGALLPVFMFVVGKALGYALLGVLLAQGGSWLAHKSADWGGLSSLAREAWLVKLRAGLAACAGFMMIVLGLRMLGIVLLPASQRAQLTNFFALHSRRLFQAFAALPYSLRPFGFGAAASLLPCGLSWSALVLAVGSSPLEAALGLALFGFATAPVLCASVLGWNLLQPTRLPNARLWLGAALVAIGLFTTWRGGFLQPARAAAVLPECCRQNSNSPELPGR